MTQVVTVHTDFTDLNQMAQGLVGRVNDTHLILPGPDPVDVGEWVEFAITLYDGTPGFAGVGRCVTVVDNGEERLSHQRFDVVIDSLQFDPRGQQVFEHILTLNGGGGYEEAAATGDESVGSAESVEDARFEDVSEVFTASKIELPTEALEDAIRATPADEEPTTIGHAQHELATATYQVDEPIAQEPAFAEEPEDVEEPVSLDPRTYGEPPASSNGAVLAPAAGSLPPRQTNGAMFAYPQGLTFPAQPPRPELEAEKRVSPAPRPDTLSH